MCNLILLLQIFRANGLAPQQVMIVAADNSHAIVDQGFKDGFGDTICEIAQIDHGYYVGDHGLMLKLLLHFQGTIGVPFIWCSASAKSRDRNFWLVRFDQKSLIDQTDADEGCAEANERKCSEDTLQGGHID